MRTVLACMLAAGIAVCGWTATLNVPADYATIQAAINAASAGDTVEVAAGTYDATILPGTAGVNKDVTVTGAVGGTTIQVAKATGYAFTMTGAGATLQNLTIVKTDKTGPHSLVLVQGANSTIQGCTFTGQYVLGDPDVSRAIETAYNTTGLLIQDNEISALRQPAYFNPGTTGDVLNNLVAGTRGWVVDGGTLYFSGNTWAGNAVDIALLVGTPFGAPYDPLSALIARNNGAVISDQRGANPYKVVNVTQQTAYTTIQAAVNAANPGDAIEAGAGTYAETVTIGKQLTITGAGDGSNPAVDTIVAPASGQRGLILTAGGGGAALTIEDLRVQGASNGLYTDSTISNVELDNVTITGCTSYAVEIHNSAVVTDLALNDCDLVSSSVGIRVRGQVDGMTITGGHIDNNTAQGIYTVAGVGEANLCDNVTITGTTFNGNGQKGIYVEKLRDAVLDGITVSGSGTSASSPRGIDINLKYAAYSNIEIRDSIIINCATGDPSYGMGLEIKGRNDGPYAGTPATLTDVTVSGCSISGCPIALGLGNNIASGLSLSGVDLDCAGGAGVYAYLLPSIEAISLSDVAITGTPSVGMFLQGMSGGTLDAADTAFAAGCTEFIRLYLTTSNVDALGCTFGGTSTPAEIEAKVYHKADEAGLGWVIYDEDQVLGNILAWDKTNQKFYLTANAGNPETGTLIESGKTYYYGGQPLVVTITGPPGDQSAVVGNASAANYLRVRWTMLGANLYRAYGWSQTAAADSLVFQRGMTYVYSDPGWDSGYWGFTHTCSHNGTAWDLTKDVDQQP